MKNTTPTHPTQDEMEQLEEEENDDSYDDQAWEPLRERLRWGRGELPPPPSEDESSHGSGSNEAPHNHGRLGLYVAERNRLYREMVAAGTAPPPARPPVLWQGSPPPAPAPASQPDSPLSPLPLPPQPESQPSPVTTQQQQSPPPVQEEPGARGVAGFLAILDEVDRQLPSQTPADSWYQHTEEGAVGSDDEKTSTAAPARHQRRRLL
jgi:hypothetical protein